MPPYFGSQFGFILYSGAYGTGYHAAILQGMCLRERPVYRHPETCTKMFIAALWHSSKNLEIMKLKEEMENKLCYFGMLL